MHFLFPADPLNSSLPDDLFVSQMRALQAVGFSTSLCPDEVLSDIRKLSGVPADSAVVYRGWMLKTEQYAHLAEAIHAAKATPFTLLTEYLVAHHLPNWYPLISEFTPETHIYPTTAHLVQELEKLGWNAFFVKDYVKSLKTSIGAIIHEPTQISRVMSEMEKFRGEIEGGICIRRVEDFITESEQRYFVVNGQCYAADENDNVPDIVLTCARCIPSHFFSVDVITRRDGVVRVVEIGDGQVSDLVGWSPDRFAQIWAKSAT